MGASGLALCSGTARLPLGVAGGLSLLPLASGGVVGRGVRKLKLLNIMKRDGKIENEARRQRQ
jgi:hypothetical protein